jgi:GNAT superfamily N-acetyltransferase
VTTYRERCAVDDVALSQLHAAAFGETPRLVAWGERLARHSLTWFGAFDGERLVGFVNVAWDGDRHAFLLDAVVAPPRQSHGIGTELVRRAVRAASDAGCTWLHVDYAADLAPFFVDRCGITPTTAGLLRLHR